MEPERAARVIQAVLENMQNWQDRALHIADNCPAGTKHDALALGRDLHMARCSLIRLTKALPPEDWDEGA